jgi:hypothetical protein
MAQRAEAMSKPVPNAEAVRDVIIEALAAGPKSKAELASQLALQPTTLSGCLTCLANRGQVVIRGGRVGLPGQMDETEAKTAEEELHEQLKMLWQRRGIVAVDPTDVEDNFVRERLCLFAMAMYGRRGARG